MAVSVVGEDVDRLLVGAFEGVELSGDGVAVGEAGPDRGADAGGCPNRESGCCFAKSDGVGGVFEGGGLERKIGDDVRGHRLIA